MLLALTLFLFLQEPISPPDLVHELDMAIERVVQGAHTPGTRDEVEARRAFEAAVYGVTQIPQWASPEVRRARARLETLAERHGQLLGSHLLTVFVAQLELGIPESALMEQLATRHDEPRLAWAVVETLARRPSAERLAEYERILALHGDEFAGERHRDDMVQLRTAVSGAGYLLQDAQQYDALTTTVERLDFLAPRVGASWGNDWFMSSEVQQGPVDIWREGLHPFIGWSRSQLRALHEENPRELLRLLLEHDFAAFQTRYLESPPEADKARALVLLRENLARLLGDEVLKLYRTRLAEHAPASEAR
jgi:hypothetical protein